MLIAAAGFSFIFDWNRAKPWVNEQVTAALGRPFAINGDLKAGWRAPTAKPAGAPAPTSFTATQLEIGNPDWAKMPARHARCRALRSRDPLLAHEIVIPSIDVVNPAVDLERLADGRNTWTFQQSSQPSPWKVRLDSFGFAKGTVTYRDAITKADLSVAIDTLGQPIPLGDVLKEQEQTSRAASAQRVGKHGAAQLSAKANAEAASSASAAQAASAASATGAAAVSAVVPASSSSTASASPLPHRVQAVQAASQRPPSGPTYAFGLKVDGRYKNVPISGTGKRCDLRRIAAVPAG